MNNVHKSTKHYQSTDIACNICLVQRNGNKYLFSSANQHAPRACTNQREENIMSTGFVTKHQLVSLPQDEKKSMKDKTEGHIKMVPQASTARAHYALKRGGNPMEGHRHPLSGDGEVIQVT